MIDVNEYIGVPYKPFGRDPEGWDCYGMVKWMFAQRGIELPDWQVDPSDIRQVTRKMRDYAKSEVGHGYAQEVTQPVDWDIVMVARTRAGSHIGIYLHSGVLHANEKLRTAWQRWNQFEQLFVGEKIRFYRWHR